MGGKGIVWDGREREGMGKGRERERRREGDAHRCVCEYSYHYAVHVRYESITVDSTYQVIGCEDCL